MHKHLYEKYLIKHFYEGFNTLSWKKTHTHGRKHTLRKTKHILMEQNTLSWKQKQ